MATSPHRCNGAVLGLVVCLGLSSAAASAQQLIAARDGVAVEALMALKEPTRVVIEGAPIVSVFGNLTSTTCGKKTDTGSAPLAAGETANPGADIAVECDAGKGEIFVRPVRPSPKPVNLFVASAQATYTLVLRPTDTPADTIVIRDASPAASRPTAAAAASPLGRAANPIRRMKALLVAMATDRIPDDIEVEEIGTELALWREARFSLLRRYLGRGLIGERYRLINISANPMVVAEQEFDREGGDVIGIAIEQHNLRPNDSTTVYVIRAGEAP